MFQVETIIFCYITYANGLHRTVVSNFFCNFFRKRRFKNTIRYFYYFQMNLKEIYEIAKDNKNFIILLQGLNLLKKK